MQTQEVAQIYEDLKAGKTVDLSAHVREHLKEYKENSDGSETQVTQVTLEMKGKYDPVIIANLYVDKREVESHFYYLDQKSQLKSLLNSWLKL